MEGVNAMSNSCGVQVALEEVIKENKKGKLENALKSRFISKLEDYQIFSFLEKFISNNQEEIASKFLKTERILSKIKYNHIDNLLCECILKDKFKNNKIFNKLLYLQILKIKLKSKELKSGKCNFVENEYFGFHIPLENESKKSFIENIFSRLEKDEKETILNFLEFLETNKYTTSVKKIDNKFILEYLRRSKIFGTEEYIGNKDSVNFASGIERNETFVRALKKQRKCGDISIVTLS